MQGIASTYTIKRCSSSDTKLCSIHICRHIYWCKSMGIACPLRCKWKWVFPADMAGQSVLCWRSNGSVLQKTRKAISLWASHCWSMMVNAIRMHSIEMNLSLDNSWMGPHSFHWCQVRPQDCRIRPANMVRWVWVIQEYNQIHPREVSNADPMYQSQKSLIHVSGPGQPSPTAAHKLWQRIWRWKKRSQKQDINKKGSTKADVYISYIYHHDSRITSQIHNKGSK